MDEVAKPVLHLHVGPHKTGSTYLQKRFRDNRGRLAEAGYLYPEVGMSAFGHHEVVNLYRGWALPEAERITAGLAELAAGETNLLLSSENFIFLSENQLARLRDAFPGHTITVSFVYRSLAEIWPSHWQELIEHGEWLPFLDYLATVMGALDRFDAGVVDPLVQLNKLAAVFGWESLVVIPYNSVSDAGGDLLPVFLADALGLAVTLPGTNEAVNRSRTPETVEMIRLLNARFFAEHGKLPGIALRQRYLAERTHFEEGEGFIAFREAFAGNAQSFNLAPDNAVQVAREQALLAAFGERIPWRAPAPWCCAETRQACPRRAAALDGGGWMWRSRRGDLRGRDAGA